MDQRAAFEDTLALAEERGMALMPGSYLGLEHLREMAVAIRAGISPQGNEKMFSEGKLGRWLGWAQCAVVAAGVATLDDMKQINMRHA